MKLSKDNAKEAYKKATKQIKKILEETFGKDFFLPNVRDKINNWDDICKLSKIHPIKSLPYANPISKLEKSLNAVFKLNKISEVLNQGIILDFNDRNQYKWYAWFKESNTGWVLDDCYCYGWYTYLGFGLYYKSKEDAEFAVNKFMDVYLDYLP